MQPHSIDSIISPKKLIEVALPLDAINVAAAREKSIRHGHPSTLHLWWARRPLAAARAVIFSQLVNDPEDLWLCQNPGVEPNKQVKGHWTKARGRLFKIIEDLVLWENTTNEEVLEKAREEIRKSWREVCELNRQHPQAADLFNPDKMPGLHDPFAGGGTIPLEAQRLGLEAHASDLNPVAVLINKAMIEIPYKFHGSTPVNPISRQSYSLGIKQWTKAQGLADDVRYYGKWMREQAEKKFGALFPKIDVGPEMLVERSDLNPFVGRQLTVIAWLWARTVKSPNPAFSHVDVPLSSSFVLSTKVGNEAYVQPVINGDRYTFSVHVGKPPSGARAGTTAGKRAGFTCVISKVPISYDYIREEGQAGRIGQKLMAIVAEGPKGRIFLSPTEDHERIALEAKSERCPDLPLHGKTAVNVPLYGMTNFGHLFTQRQLIALSTFSDLVMQARDLVMRDSEHGSISTTDQNGIVSHGERSVYANAVALYLGFVLSKSADYWSNACLWRSDPKNLGVGHVFSRQALAMAWDYAEANPFSSSSGNWLVSLDWVTRVVDQLPAFTAGFAEQASAQTMNCNEPRLISTDPPYYDNIGYADLSDFFYVWMRPALREAYPELLNTIAVPKEDELVATPIDMAPKIKLRNSFWTE